MRRRALSDEAVHARLGATLVLAKRDRAPAARTETWDPGTFAVRGSLLDVWAPGASEPVRVELYGDLVVSIKPFDPATQTTRLGRTPKQRKARRRASRRSGCLPRATRSSRASSSSGRSRGSRIWPT
ncbi:MAG TPA: hypothetical protein VM925_17405 [Labilithrix sp.]|nr:hypothetical protein [Labilithrix sp.]